MSHIEIQQLVLTASDIYKFTDHLRNTGLFHLSTALNINMAV